MVSEEDARRKAALRHRFRSVAGSVGALGLACALGVLLYLRQTGSTMPWNARLAIGLGVALSFAVAGVLMGLLFLSHRSGHDIDADRRDLEE